MPPVPQRYPHGLPDDELAEAIEALAQVPANWPTPILPELTLALLNAGMIEQTRRELAVSSRIAKLALGVAVLSLVVAVIAVLAT